MFSIIDAVKICSAMGSILGPLTSKAPQKVFGLRERHQDALQIDQYRLRILQLRKSVEDCNLPEG
jgi:hypothetical protein